METDLKYLFCPFDIADSCTLMFVCNVCGRHLGGQRNFETSYLQIFVALSLFLCLGVRLNKILFVFTLRCVNRCIVVLDIKNVCIVKKKTRSNTT